MRSLFPRGYSDALQSVLFQKHTQMCVSAAKRDSPIREINVEKVVSLSFGYLSTEGKIERYLTDFES